MCSSRVDFLTAKEEKEVMKILTQVSVTKREQEIKLDEADFDEKKKINKRKKLITKGFDPEEADRQLEKSTQQTGRKRKRRGKPIDKPADDL